MLNPLYLPDRMFRGGVTAALAKLCCVRQYRRRHSKRCQTLYVAQVLMVLRAIASCRSNVCWRVAGKLTRTAS